MSYLLDTHTLIWAFVASDKLSVKVKHLLKFEPQVFISAISFWEISLKYRLSKLDLKGKTPDELVVACLDLKYNILNLDSETAASFYKIPKISNKDPFDLMLAWQAINENFTLISKDKGFDDFNSQGLKRVW